ncbi:MAG: hypothetical protein L3J34_08640 [Flavobacteriaceae bacterium]|nr:hypothetical protein [Flavobacteriaceae bacterium]
MKKFINKIILALFAVTAFISCNTDPDNAIYGVLDGKEHGAIIRTLERVSSNFNLFDKSSEWEVIVEAQDEEYGDLLQSIEVYVSFTDNFDDGEDYSKPEVFVASFPASVFTTSANGLPSTGVKSTLGESLTALSLNDGEYTGGDTFNYRMEYVMTDGRTFSSADGSGSLQGSYFSSPYLYQAGLLCIPEIPFPGDYKIVMQDSYGDGWNGASISVVIDGVSTDYTIAGSSGTEIVNIPVGSTTGVFIFKSGAWDSEITFQIYTPSGNLGVSTGPSPVVGEIALNLCQE